jgi:glycosyltransferase involved in cell wall biosynthesis
LIVGDGRLKGELQNQAKTLGISENILFLGERPDVANILSAIDIVVMPSVSDGLPLSALEAMAMGKAIIGYNVGGIPEAVIHNRTGILINKRDPLLLAEGIMTLLSNKHLCQAMGKAGQIRVMDSFNIEVVSRKHRELYSQYFGNYKGLAKLRCRENLLES